MLVRSLVAMAFALVLSGLASAPAWGQNSVFLDPALQLVGDGETAGFDLDIDFTDPALGGGIVIGFDPTHLTFDSFSFDASFPDDPLLRLVCPSADPACGFFPGPGVLVAFAVDSISVPAIVGAHTVGRLRFHTLHLGSSELTLSEDDSVAGPLVGVGSFDPPTLSGAQVAPSVPALGGVGLLVLGLGFVLAARGALRSLGSGSSAYDHAS